MVVHLADKSIAITLSKQGNTLGFDMTVNYAKVMSFTLLPLFGEKRSIVKIQVKSNISVNYVSKKVKILTTRFCFTFKARFRRY